MSQSEILQDGGEDQRDLCILGNVYNTGQIGCWKYKKTFCPLSSKYTRTHTPLVEKHQWGQWSTFYRNWCYTTATEFLLSGCILDSNSSIFNYRFDHNIFVINELIQSNFFISCQINRHVKGLIIHFNNVLFNFSVFFSVFCSIVRGIGNVRAKCTLSSEQGRGGSGNSVWTFRAKVSQFDLSNT